MLPFSVSNGCFDGYGDIVSGILTNMEHQKGQTATKRIAYSGGCQQEVRGISLVDYLIFLRVGFRKYFIYDAETPTKICAELRGRQRTSILESETYSDSFYGKHWAPVSPVVTIFP